MLVRDRKLMCNLLGLSYKQIKREHIQGLDPKRPRAWHVRISHPRVGAAVRTIEFDAWHKFFDLADKKLSAPLLLQKKMRVRKVRWKTEKKVAASWFSNFVPFDSKDVQD